MSELKDPLAVHKCRECEMEWAGDGIAINFYWHKAMNGYEYICKACKKEQRRQREQMKPRKEIDKSSGGRKCESCKEWQPNENFRDDMSYKGTTRTVTRGDCRDCEKDYQEVRSRMKGYLNSTNRTPGGKRKMLVLTLPGARPVSENQVIGSHWSKYKDAKHDAMIGTRAAMPRDVVEGIGFPLEERVDIWFHVYFDRRPQDSDNPVLKYHKDALFPLVIEDDSPEFVGHVGQKSFVDKENPRIEIIITREYI